MQHLMLVASIVAIVAFLVAMGAGIVWAGQSDDLKVDRASYDWDYSPWIDQLPYIPWSDSLNEHLGVGNETY